LVAKVTERTFYPALIDIIRQNSGAGVSEVSYNAEPDIVFDFIDRKWILGVKLGESIPVLKQAFIQYHRHKDESKINHGILLFLPEEAREIEATATSIARLVNEKKCTCLIDTPGIKEDLRAITFPHLLQRLRQEIVPRLQRNERKEYSLQIVIALLQQHVVDTMRSVKLTEKTLLQVITDKQLLSGIGHLDQDESDHASQFLATYIVLSQILFLRLFSRSNPQVLPPFSGFGERKVNIQWLRTAFGHVLDINYKPIFQMNVLEAIPESYIQDTFDLIWGLEIERIRYELPGRLFHALMPKTIRKMLAAFYTRPEAANLLARLTIQKSGSLVYDCACGSGTILVSAYRRKQELYQQEGGVGSPHKRYCEEEIFGSDIMPFAVHLTSANLASMEPSVTIEKTEIIQGDSLGLSKGYTYPGGVQLTLFPATGKGYKMSGEKHDVHLDKVDAILMNPPFTKVERGIRQYVDMERFGKVCGNEVGLWGHFILLANEFLNGGGMFGGVIPISLLRGRESAKIREFVFSKWTPLYILKSTFNYGFSEWSEYRDVLFIARKGEPPKGHRVKFALIKKDLGKLTATDVSYIGNQLETTDRLRSEELDVETFSIDEMRDKFGNMMWFCGVTDMKNREALVSFIHKLASVLTQPPPEYFREGYRPVPKGVSSFMFVTRASDASRLEEAFLCFKPNDESSTQLKAQSQLETTYQIEKAALTSSLRTGIGIKTLDITKGLDYIANSPYKEFDRVLKSTKFEKPSDFKWPSFWANVKRELSDVGTHIVTVRRINPYSPNTHLTAFFSKRSFSPSNVLNVVTETDTETAKAFCALLNSVVFLSQFFLLKEETTGRYIDIRFYDFYEMRIFPKKDKLKALAAVFDDFSNKEFPSLREQLDRNFDARYEAYWTLREKIQQTLFAPSELSPSNIRVEFDMAICKALRVPMTKKDLHGLYRIIVDEMIITRGLTKD